jgi:hypothetical protein
VTVAYRSVFLAVSVAVLLLSGCSMGDMNSPAPTLSTLPHISGVVRGGQSPISGATIQLYETNTTANAGPSIALGSSVTTLSDGTFSITGDYTCPASNPLVYLVSSGGNPGMSGTVNNSDITLMASLGTCSQLTSSTVVIINELSTVVTATALAPFMTDATHIGEAPTNPVALAGAMKEFTSIGAFGSSGTFGTLDFEILELAFNTQANILAACVNTAGGTSGDGSACGNLLLWTGGSDTATAALAMSQAPTHNASSLYGLITAGAPFQPYFSALPSDLAVTVGYPTPYDLYSSTQVTGTLDSNGHIWLYFGGYSYDPVANTSTDNEGSLIVYDSNFNQLFTVAAGTGGLYYPHAFSADTSGNVYAINANNTITELNSTGGAVSPSTVGMTVGGWSTGVTPSFTGTGSGNGYQTNGNQAGPPRVDKNGTIWGIVPSFSSSHCFYEVSVAAGNPPTATVITPASTTTFCNALTDITDIQPDGAGNAWALGFSAIAEVNGTTGAVVNTAATTQGCMYPESLVTTNTIYQETSNILYDNVHNQLWGYSGVGAGAITDGGSGVFCNDGATTMPVIVPYSNSTGVGNPYSAGYLTIGAGALDGAGNFWFVTTGTAATGTETGTGGAFNGTATFSAYLSEVKSNGSLGTSYNMGSGVYGDQPSGMGANGSATVNGQGVYTAGQVNVGLVGVLGIDSSGNIWVLDDVSLRVIKISGLATANTMNY